MAIFHFTVSVRSRAKGSSSSVAGSAYLSGQQRKDEGEGRSWNFANKNEEVLHHEVLLPKSAPEAWKQQADLSEHSKVANTLWNSVEAAEKQSNAQVCRNFEWALPNELSLEDQKELVREYIQKNFVDQGMCFEYSICKKIGENGQLNMHVHGQATLRRIKEDGSWETKIQKQYLCRDSFSNDRYMRPDELKQYPDFEKVYKYKIDNKIVEWTPRQAEKYLKEKKPNIEPKILKKELKAMRVSKYALYTNIDTVDWNKKEKVEEWRSSWAEYANKYLEKFNQKIDHRSYERQGIDQMPTIHEGYAAREMEKRGEVSDRMEINREIIHRNRTLALIVNEIKEISNQISRLVKENLTTRLKSVWEQLKKPHFEIRSKTWGVDQAKKDLDEYQTELQSLGLFERDRKKNLRSKIEYTKSHLEEDRNTVKNAQNTLNSIFNDYPEIEPYYQHAKTMTPCKSNPYFLREFDEVKYSKYIYDLGVQDMQFNEMMVSKFKLHGETDPYDLVLYSRSVNLIIESLIKLNERNRLMRNDNRIHQRIEQVISVASVDINTQNLLKEFFNKTKPLSLQERLDQAKVEQAYNEYMRNLRKEQSKEDKEDREWEPDL